MEYKHTESDAIAEINRKLAKLEQRIIDLIIPIQNIADCLKSTTDIQYLIKALKGPIPIDDHKLKHLLKSFESEMRDFDKNIEKMNKTLNEHSIGEIKYIGNRLNEIEKTLHKIMKKMIEDQEVKRVRIDFTCDGYDLVKKPIGYDPTEPTEDPFQDIKNLLDSLPERFAKVIVHRLGLLGESAKTYEQVAKVFGLKSRENIRAAYAKAIRLCRHPSRRPLVDKLPDRLPEGALKKEILGDAYCVFKVQEL